MPPTAVVVGLHQNGLGVARALGRRGVPVIALDEFRDSVFSATRYARGVSVSDMRGAGLIESLRTVGSSFDGKGVLIPTLDRSVLLVSEHRAEIEPFFVHSLPADAVIQQLMNKTETEQFARANGFKVPRTYSLRTEDDLDRCISEIEMPCILKPEVKTVAFVEHSPKKAFFVKSVDELRDTWHRVVQWEPVVIVQEWIPGPETSLVFCLYYFGEGTRPIAAFGGRKIRQFIPHCGTACSAEPWDDPICYDEGVRFFTAAGYRGFGAIEFKVDPDGQYFLIEPTVGRTEHIFALAAANGINLPYAGYCDMAGLPVPAMNRRRRAVIYVDWKRDLRAARTLVDERQLTWPGWLGSIAHPQQHALLAWDDPAPFARHVRDRLTHKAGRFAARAGNAVRRQMERLGASGDVTHDDLGAATTPRRSTADARQHVEAALEWLSAAQDAAGGGVARGFSCSRRSGYVPGWQAAYPETTGYIIPTFFDCAEHLQRPDLADRAIRMADWALTVQLDHGGFPGGTVDRRRLPVVFNTGMVLLGLTRAYSATHADRYREPIQRAAEFLLRAQARDGSWRRFVNFDGTTGIHAYDSLVTWGLATAARQAGEQRWADAALRNLHFTLTLQAVNGWFSHNALRPKRHATPLTHTIAYTTSGLLEAGVLLNEPRFVAAAERTAKAVAERLGPDGFLAGEFDAEWRAAADWSCLTGTAQMAINWFRLFEIRGDERYGDAARRATLYLRSRHELVRGGSGTRGGIAGSFPIGAPYGRYQFLNWAAKFFVDALVLEERLTAQAAGSLGAAPPAGMKRVR